MKAGDKQSHVPSACMLISSLAYSSNLKVEVTCFIKNVSMTFNGLHGVISQKAEVFIMATVRTSNPTNTSLTRNTF
jgi:hypothetical protein